jgi:hypothetical protein
MLPNDPVMIQQLATAAEQAINDTLEKGGPRSPRPRGEVSAVRTLVLDGFDGLADAWEPVLRPASHRVELTAIFTHSRPHVSFSPKRYTKSTGRCELADLLIVIDHQDYSGKVDERRAALVQAKRNKGGKIKLSGSDWTQHELLLDLCAFTFVDPGYDPRVRTLAGTPLVGLPKVTAEYGGVEIDGTPRQWKFWLPEAPDDLVADVPIGTYLASMAAGLDQYGREADPGGNDDWSFTVDELLRVTGALPIVKSDKTVLRSNPNVIGLVADMASYLSVPPGLSAAGGPYKPEDEEYWPEGPISVAHLTFRQAG